MASLFSFSAWPLNLIFALIFAVLFVQFYKVAVKDTNEEGAATVILEVLGGLSCLLLLPFFAWKFSFDPKIYGLFLLASVFYAFNDRIQVSVRKNLEVSVFTIIYQLSRVFLIVYGVIIFREPVAVLKLVGAALILGGTAALFYRAKKFVFNKYVWLSALASWLMATAIIIDVGISTLFNLPFYIMLTLLVPALINYLVFRVSWRKLWQELNSSRRKFYIIDGLVYGPMVLFTIRALQLGQVVVIAPLLASSVLVNVMIASVAHHERIDLWRKVVIAALIVLGIYLTVV